MASPVTLPRSQFRRAWKPHLALQSKGKLLLHPHTSPGLVSRQHRHHPGTADPAWSHLESRRALLMCRRPHTAQMRTEQNRNLALRQGAQGQLRGNALAEGQSCWEGWRASTKGQMSVHPTGPGCSSGSLDCNRLHRPTHLMAERHTTPSCPSAF